MSCGGIRKPLPKKKDKSIIKGIKDIAYPESGRRDLLAVWAVIWTMPWPNKRPNQINDRLLQLGPLLHLLCRFPSLFFALSSLQLLQNYLTHPMQTIGDKPNAKTSRYFPQASVGSILP
jgi:hypothetical protein